MAKKAKDRLLTMAEVAGILKLTRQRVHQLYEEGRLKSHGWFGDMLVFTESDVKEFKKQKRPPGRPPNEDE